jgi:uncharacterized protein
MKSVRLVNRTQGVVLCERCALADTFWRRVRGLQFRAPLAEDEGLLITNCSSVHMIGVRFALDVVFLSSENRVTDWVENLPGGFHFYIAKARPNAAGQTFGKPVYAVELPAGAITRSSLQLGDEIARDAVDSRF